MHHQCSRADIAHSSVNRSNNEQRTRKNYAFKQLQMADSQASYRKGLGSTEPLLTISHLLQKSLDTGMGSYIYQLDFSAAFDKVSHSGLLLMLVAVCCPFVESSSPAAGRESWLMAIKVS